MATRQLPPTPKNIAAVRAAAGLTQDEAAAMVELAHSKRWSEFENGKAPIDTARWELFLIKTGRHADYRPADHVEIPIGKVTT